MSTYYDQTFTREYPATLARSAMLEAFVEFLPALVARALLDSEHWPAALAALEQRAPRAYAFTDAAQRATYDCRPTRSLAHLGVLALISLAIDHDAA